jgi:hypothetical protein
MSKLVEVTDEIFTVDDLFTPQECQHWISYSESLGYQPAPVNTAAGPQRQEEVRNNSRVLWDDQHQANQIWERIAEYVPNVVSGWTAVGLNDRMRFYRYDVGEKFRWHGDGSHRRGNGQRSFLTFLVYLNDDFNGGETAFRGGVQVEPSVGRGLLFCHWLKHMGAEVLQGRKYVLRSDVMYARQRL